MKTLTLIGGVNGAGKSSLTGVLKAETRLGPVIDVDLLAQKGGLSPIDAGKKAVALIDGYLRRGISFTQETTLAGVKTLRTVKRAREAGYFIRLYYVGLDTAAESVKRIENRVAKGGHDINREDVLRRFDGRFDALMKLLPYCDEVTLFDNENGFAEAAVYKNGELSLRGALPPQWVRDLAARLET